MPLSSSSPGLQGRLIVCFGNDWHADPTSKHHIMRRLSRHNRVLWVESAGMRRPDLRRAADARRLLAKAKTVFYGTREVADNVTVLSPPTLPLPGSRVAAFVNRMFYRAALKRAVRRLSRGTDPILWVFAPHVAPWIERVPRSLLLYYCVDRWSAFQGYDAAHLDRCEEMLCREADVVVATAGDLVERCKRYRKDVFYVPHGVDFEHFAQALEPGLLPEDLAGIPEPRIGFFGLIHEWVDTDLIARLAVARPAYAFVLIGSSDQDMSALVALPNVHVLGRRPFTVLPSYCRGFQATIIPFRHTELTHSVNPIKLREYAAAGLPVVSSDMPEVRRCGDIVTCAITDAEWLVALDLVISRGSDPAERRAQSERVRGQDWSEVCRVVAGHILDAESSRSSS